MNSLTDACYELLGIPQEEQPADRYRLLGISRFESNPQVIKNAADRQMSFVRSLASGPFSKLSQELLNLLAEARTCLLNAERRAAYDETLEDSPAAAEASEHSPSSLALEEMLNESQPSLPSSDYVSECSGEAADEPDEEALAEQKRTHEESPPVEPIDTLDQVHCGEDSPSETACPTEEWLIGSGKHCDVVVSDQYVSRVHCRLQKHEDGYLLMDLGSRNGTYVNGTRVVRAVSVSPEDRITLGRRKVMPWPTEQPGRSSADQQVLTVGRAKDNQIVIRDNSVSKYHALLRLEGDRLIVIDLGSRNGTYIDNSKQRVGYAVLSGEGNLRFGRYRMPTEALLVG